MLHKKLFYLLFTLQLPALTLYGQSRWDPPAKFYFETDIRSGEFNEKLTTSSLTANYTNPLNPLSEKINFTGNKSIGFSMQLGYYFNEDRNIGIGTGFLFQSQTGTLITDSFHIEYEATDYKGNVFRQLVSSDGGINESIKTSNLSIPLYLRYKKTINEDLFLTVDMGIIFCLLEQNKYSTNSGFDYEAIYKFQGSGNNLTYLYDDASTPGPTDWLVTRAQFLKNNPTGDVSQYFNFLNSLGYSVALNDSVQKTGKIKFVDKSIGFYFQSGINYKIRDKIYGKGGIYVFSESFTNPAANTTTPITTSPGSYNSLMYYTKSVTVINYGFLFGIDFIF